MQNLTISYKRGFIECGTEGMEKEKQRRIEKQLGRNREYMKENTMVVERAHTCSLGLSSHRFHFFGYALHR